jgi:hypothetical protein
MSEVDKLVYEWYEKHYPQWLDEEVNWYEDEQSNEQGGRS